MENVEKQIYGAVYLSPHLDDAVYSCGGRIAQQTAAGERVLIVTLMAGDPPERPLSVYAQSLHDRWELETAATAGRRAEDVAACRALGADYDHWTLPDCIYRRHRTTGEPLYTSDEAIFAAVHPDDVALADVLAEQLAALSIVAAAVYVPLTVGHHVDHQLTRLAAEKWRPSGTPFYYYEDYPYAADPAAVALVLGDEEGWVAQVCPLEAADLSRKAEAMAQFVSQMSTFFVDRADMEKQIKNYAYAVGGERVWQKRGV